MLATGFALLREVILAVTGALVSTPPLDTPPSSLSVTVTFATPVLPGARVNLRVPSTPTAGCAKKMELLSFVAVKLRV